MNNTVVCTGGSGFIGSHLVETLRNDGKKVIIIDKNPPPEHLMHNDVIYQYADLSRDDFVFEAGSPEVLYHLAADPTLIINDKLGWFHGSESAFYNNTVSTYNALNKIFPQKVVFSSSANIYGETRNAQEEAPVSITSQYGYSKLLSEFIIKYSTIPYVIFRFGTVVGPRGKTFPNRLVYCAINNIPVNIFHQGTACRDIIDVRDIVSGLLKANGFVNNIYNLSIGQEIFIGDLANLVSNMALERGYKPKFTLVDGSALGYIKESTLNTDKIYNMGWTPKYDIYETIESLFDYYEHAINVVVPPGV